MTVDPVERAQAVVAAMDRADREWLHGLFPSRFRDWVDEYLSGSSGWGGIEDLVGPGRSIVAARALSPTMARLILEGERGSGAVTVHFDDEGTVRGFALYGEEFDGIGTVVVACPPERRHELDDFYAALLGRDRRRLPGLGFGAGRVYRRPRWPDSDAPAQMHLDIRVRDLDDAEQLVTAHGASRLRVGAHHRVYEDPIGHPFCLYPGGDQPVGSLWRIVVDCFSPRSLALYYEGVLGFGERFQDSAELVVIGPAGGRLPLLAFQHVPHYVAPRWPDPAYPQQVHFDLKFDDREAAEARALSLGASPLPPQGGSCPVYADPAGHPSCFCYPGE